MQSIATELLALFEQAKSDLQQQVGQKGITVSNEMLEKLAFEAAQKEYAMKDGSATKMQASIGAFTKYDAESSPETYLQTFEEEASLANLDESQKVKIFPSLMLGLKATISQAELRACSTWRQMKQEFIDFFKIDKNILQAEIRSLRCLNYDVEKYTTDFMKLAQYYPILNQSDQDFLKQLYADQLPFKVREKIMTDSRYSQWKLAEVQGEARRLQKTYTYLNRGTKFEQKLTDKQDEDKENQPPKPSNISNRRQNRLGITQLMNRLHVFVSSDQKACNQTSETEQEIHSEIEDVCQEAAIYFSYLAKSEVLLPYERNIHAKAVSAIADHLHRAQTEGMSGAGTQTPGRRISARDLLTEAQRILIKSSGGLTLYDRLKRDPELREDMVELLKDLSQRTQDEQLESGKPEASKRKQPRKSIILEDEEMKDVGIQRLGASVISMFSEEELEKFKKYYGSHPQLLDGFKYIKNSEKQMFLQKITETDNDVTQHQPVKANVPQISICVGGKYKVRAIIDSASTSTIISDGLLKLIPEVKQQVVPTSLTFSGVVNGSAGYEGLIKGLSLQLSSNIEVDPVVAVVQNKEPMLLIGQDVMGGRNARLKTVALNTDYSFYTVIDEQTGAIANLHYLKNYEASTLPEPTEIKLTLDKSEDKGITKLFR